MAADLALSLAAPFIEYLIAPVGRQCGYILFYRSYLRELEDGVDKLKVELEGIQHKCEAAERNAMDIETKVTNWIHGVNGAVKDADSLLLGELQPGANTVIPLDGCHSWFKRCICLDHPAVTLSHQAEQIGDAIPQDVDLRARKRFFYLNPVVCYKKGRKAKKTMLVVQGLNEDRMNLRDISYEAFTSPILSAQDYESLGSRREIVENIIKAFNDAEVPAIGVWGMGGVGKSTLMKEVMRLAKEKSLFEDVAMAVVSQNPDVKKIQGELAVWLGLKFKDDENVSVRAARLRKRLKPTDKKKSTEERSLDTTKQTAVRPTENQDGTAFQFFQWKNSGAKSTAEVPVAHEKQDQVDVGEMDKKSIEPVVEEKSDAKQKQVLIILDDIWRILDLEEIGIPLEGGAVKLLLTSRKQHVLSSEMNCSRNVFKLEVLMGKEPWRLFQSIVGEIVTPDTQGKNKFRSIGEEVVAKCSGLPIVLKAIATTLKNCNLQEWKDALVQFKGSKDAYSNLEISYRHLESEELKSLFLVCALTNDAYINVEYLLYYCMGLGLLTGTSTVRSARDKLKALLHDLQDSSLLLKDVDQDPAFVHIHDVVREVAIRIASRDQDSLLIHDEFKLKEIPQKKLKNSKAISIPYVKFRKLPEGWECPELNMFLLYRRVDDPPIGISDSFFEGMKELNVLDFSGCRCDSLPSSIQFLLNLNTLCLDSCSIEDLAIIGKLKKLQILTFIGSEIARLPKEIGELNELKVLNLINSKLEVIEPQVLGKLTSLEELHLKGSSFIGWEDEEEIQPKNAKLSELNNLSNLSIVNIQIPNPDTIPKQLEFGNLSEYIIQIGDVWDWTGDYSESRTLKIKLELFRGSFLHEKWVQDLLKHTQDLHLDGIKSRQRSIHELCLDGFQELKHLHVQNSSLVQCVARPISKWLPCTAFTILESLFLKKLAGLEMISRGPIASTSFSKLKVIKVIDCGKLKCLFSYSMLKGLSQLIEIEVRDCEAMQVIITVDSVATNTEAVKLEALHRIELHNLPNIVTFCSSHRVEVDWAEINPRSSEIVLEDPCIPINTMFPKDQLVSFPLLKSVILSSLPKLKYIWQNNCPVDQVANLEYLEVSSCDDLLIVIPSSLINQVTKLETLMVRDCGSLQELFETSDGDALNLTSDVEILSRLNNLELSNLPFLRQIWENNQLEKVKAFQNLNLLKVVNCCSLINLLPAALLKSLNQLRNIYVKSCKEMKTVVLHENDGRSGETKNIVFESLVDVYLEDLPSMVTFVWTKRGESINFPAMKELYVKECPKMRSFCLVKEDESAHDDLCFFDDKVRLPKIGRLDLISMSNIQKIWHEENLEESFFQLEILLIEDCESLVDVIPSMNMTAAGIGRLQFQNLKEIIIAKCTSLEGPIFKFLVEEEGMGNKGHYYSLSRLDRLGLIQLPKLEHVVQPDSHVVVGFPSLVDIGVAECQCLIDVFPIATAATLSKLQDLRVLKCRSMRQIFGKDEEVEKDDEMLDSILFPCFRSITIQDLDSLISFFSGTSCTLGFPSLEILDISRCSKLKTFVQSHTNDQTLEPSPPFTKEGVHYLFDDKIELPNLKKVELYELSILQTVWKTKLHCLNICDTVGQITEIIINNCERLEEFIFESVHNAEKEIKTTTNDRLVFHSLAIVRLRNLPNMVSFIRARRDQTINFPFLKELYVESCPKMRALYLPNTEESGGGSLPLCFFDHKVLLPKLLKLDFVSVGSMEKIWQEEISQKSFCQIEQIFIKDCQKLVNVFPSNMMGGFHFQNLKKIWALGCPSLEGSLFDFGGVAKKGSNECKRESWSLPQLENFWLIDLPKLKHVVKPTSHVVYSFPNLVEASMVDNPCVLDLFPISTAPTLSKLETLDIYRCCSMRHVFVEDKVEEEMMMDDPIILLPCLRSIKVQNLDNLMSFFSRTSSVLHFQSLEALQFYSCPKLNTFVQRYTGDELKECAAESVRYLFDDKVLVPKVVELNLISVGSFERIWHEEIFEESCFQLETIRLKDCQNLVKVFPSKYVTRSQKRLLFENLKEIIIHDCNSLEGSLFEFVWEEGEDKGKQVLSLPLQLEKLWLVNLPKLDHMIHPASDVVVEFQILVEISIVDCQCLIALLPIATAVTLFKLEKVEILRCSSMRYLFGKEEEDEDGQMLDLILFPCLRFIQVQNLNSLICFFMGTARQLDFPSLEDLEISWCPVLKTFVQRHKTEGIHYYLFDDKVEFPNLEKMKLVHLSSLQTIWKKDELLPSNSDSCSRLKSLTVSECKDLQHICPASFASNLAQLEELCIDSCEALEEIVIHGDDYGTSEELDGVNSSQMFLFPLLTTLVLNDLPSLRSFFRGSNASTWSALKRLWVWHCDKVQIFTTTKFSSENSSTRQSLFSAEQVIPNLEILRLVEEDAIMIQDGKFEEVIFNELKHFSLSCFHNERSAGFPSRFMLDNNFQKLETLIVYCSSFEEIFADESLSPQEIISYKERFAFAGDGNEKPLARLMELMLSELDNLKHVWGSDMTLFSEILKSIQLLEVTDCPMLKNLFTTASCSFGNITAIRVSDCNGMQMLVTSSAATSLVRLNKLDIYDCEMIGAIVSPDESKPAEEEDGELLVIRLRELKHIGLHRLPRLISFSSANCIFELPSLEEVIVIECPNLNVFSSNTVVAPKLSKVMVSEEEETGQVHWDGDINTTIQNLPKS